jgi:hypothetical protein
MNIRPFFWHNLVCMNLPKNVGASAHARAAVPQATWGQPPSAVRRSQAPRMVSTRGVELRSTGQPRAAVPTWLVVLPRERSRLHRVLCLLLFSLSWHAYASAQDPAVVTFTLDFPGSEPSHYAVSVSADGHSTYDSDGKLSPDSEGDPFHMDFSMSGETRRRVFELAEKAHYFQGEIDSKKKNLASTGAKTLTYRDSSRNTKATYNYSPLVPVQQVTALFQSLSTTLEFGRRLQYFHHYQKLALDEELKRMEAIADQDDLEEMAAVLPILQQIASDTSVINPVRARAQRMIERAGRVKP